MVVCLLEQIGLDCSKPPLNNFFHSWLYEQCQRDRDSYLEGVSLDNTKSLELAKYILNSQPAIATAREESYGNTPLHIACALYSLDFAALIAGICSEAKSVENDESKTPLEMALSEIKH